MAAQISLTSFIDFTASVGSPRMKVPVALRAMYEDPTRRPWDYYGGMKGAVVEGFRTDRLPECVSRAVAAARVREAAGNPWLRGQSQHFARLADGAVAFRSRIGKVEVLPPTHAVWAHQHLAIRVNPPLAVRRSDGREEVLYLYMKSAPLTQGGADTALAVMTDVLAQAAPSSAARIVDVRTGHSFTLSRRRKVPDLLRYARSEAEAFMRLWDAADAA